MSTRPRRRALSAALLLTLMAPAAWAQDDDAGLEAFGASMPLAKAAPKAPRETPSRRMTGAMDPALAPQVALSTIDHEALLHEDAIRQMGTQAKVLRFSVGRALTLAARDGSWTDLADGSRLWVADVVSPGALGLRLHFSGVSLPEGAELAVWGDAEAGSFDAAAPAKGAAEFHFGSAAARPEFWTGTIAGERAHVEYLVPPGAAREDELPFRLDNLQHVYRDPIADLTKAAGPCHNDVTCFPQWGALASAVSGIGTVGSDQGVWCTGQLLNISGKKPDFTPYWLTANHCLDNQADASSAEFFWGYQTSACGGPAPSLFSVPRSVGATLLSTNPLSDYTLLLIEGALPPGLFWSGWTSKKVKDGTPVVAIHHPDGDFKRISFGVKSAVGECAAGFPGRKTVHIDWTDAPTEPGSSGSGVFLASTGQLFGQLFGGPSSCDNETFDCYGDFNSTFPRIKKFLKGGSDDKSEQNDACGTSRLAKPGVLGGRIVKVVDSDWYRISIPAGRTVRVELAFANANGDVDAAVYASCKGQPILVVDGTTDGEAFTVENVGNRAVTVWWRVYLANDTRNSYDMAVGFQ